MLPDPSLFALQRRLKNWVVGCMEWSCDRVSYVTSGRPIYIEDSFHVWRMRGPYPSQQIRSPVGVRELVDLGVTVCTCTGTTPELLADGTVSMPTPEEWEQAAARHEGDVAAVYALLKRRTDWLPGSTTTGHQEADPDAETAGGCYGTTIRFTVPWTAAKDCDNCAPPDVDDGEVC